MRKTIIPSSSTNKGKSLNINDLPKSETEKQDIKLSISEKKISNMDKKNLCLFDAHGDILKPYIKFYN